MSKIDWDDGRVSRLTSMYQGGASVREIASYFHISESAAKNAARRYCDRNGPARNSSTWSPERDGVATSLYVAGRSASEIAKALGGGVSRNAVIGRLSRMGVTRTDRPNKTQSAPRSFKRAKAPRVVSNRSADAQGGGANIMNRVEAPLTPMGKDHGLTATATLTTLGAHACKWPIGDPRDADFGFCARPRTHHAYCEAHRAVAYQSVPEARDRAREIKRAMRYA